MKSKIFSFPEIEFEIIPTCRETAVKYLKKHKLICSSVLTKSHTNAGGSGQPHAWKTLIAMAQEGIIKDLGMKTVMFKGMKRSTNVRMYERI